MDMEVGSFPCNFFKKNYFRLCKILIWGCLGVGYLFPLEAYYLFQIDGGINFYNQNEDKIKSRYRLSNLRNTIAPVLNVRTGTVWNQHWLTMLGYGYIRREDYDFPLHYFTLNQKVYEQREIHNAHLQVGYFLFPYQSGFNISLEMGLGWALYRSLLTTIDNYSKTSSGLREITEKLIFQTHQFYLNPTLKLYKNLRKGFGLGGDIYFGVQYPMIFPSKINFPEIILGFDASINFSYTSSKEKKTFAPKSEFELPEGELKDALQEENKSSGNKQEPSENSDKTESAPQGDL